MATTKSPARKTAASKAGTRKASTGKQAAENAPSGKAPPVKALQAKSGDALALRQRPLRTPSDLGTDATKDIAAGLAGLLADTFALYIKTKNFHWHMSGPNFRDYHLLLDEQADQIFAMTDPMAERARKIGGRTVKSIGEISRKQRISDNDAEYVDPQDMLSELRDDNLLLVRELRAVHELSDDHNDSATTSLLEVWIDETERRVWFLFESTRPTQ